MHPQHWPADLDHAGQRVVVIGSGATAVTLVPALAETAASVTMLQRTPTCDRLAAVGRPDLGRAARAAARRGRLPRGPGQERPAVALQLPTQPAPSRGDEGDGAQGPRPAAEGYDIATHFTPPYDPWDQRFCIVPDGDLFRAIRSGRAHVVTGVIDTFTPTGVRLTSGEEVEADVVVTATGLQLQALGGVRLVVDGSDVDLPSTVAYKGAMFSGVPNLAAVFGYTNASWTLRADLISDWVCRCWCACARAAPTPSSPSGRASCPTGRSST